jgi:hypothetical protein
MRFYLCFQGSYNPIDPQPSTGEAAEKGFALFEAQPSLQSPGSIEEHRASRLWRDKGHGGPFFGSFLWASKEMNRRIKNHRVTEIAWYAGNEK